jgi:hypothetical protein
MITIGKVPSASVGLSKRYASRAPIGKHFSSVAFWHFEWH